MSDPVRRSVATSRDIVPGDVLVLETGNIIPADGRLIEAVNLDIEEAPLTGESVPVSKDAERVYRQEVPVADRRNTVYRGTTVTRGRGIVVVTDTGMQTELGRIAGLLQSVEEERTPLQRRLDHLAKVLAIVALGIVALLFAIGITRGESVETMLLTSVSLAVAAIPEAMPAVVTIALSLGAQRMLRRKALIRRLPAVETLGSVSVICSDKTGTLTENRMTVTVLDLANEAVVLTGESSGPLTPTETGADEIAQGLEAALAAGALCNDATLTVTESGNRSVGDPTETAIVLAAAELEIPKPDLEDLFPRIDEVPFDSTRKRMTTIHSVPDSLPTWVDGIATVFPPETSAASFMKGAVERVIESSSSVLVAGTIEPMSDEWERRIIGRTEEIAATGTRVLAVAGRGWGATPDGEPGGDRPRLHRPLRSHGPAAARGLRSRRHREGCGNQHRHDHRGPSADRPPHRHGGRDRPRTATTSRAPTSIVWTMPNSLMRSSTRRYSPASLRSTSSVSSRRIGKTEHPPR